MQNWAKNVVDPAVTNNQGPSPYQDFADELDVMAFGGPNALQIRRRSTRRSRAGERVPAAPCGKRTPRSAGWPTGSTAAQQVRLGRREVRRIALHRLHVQRPEPLVGARRVSSSRGRTGSRCRSRRRPWASTCSSRTSVNARGLPQTPTTAPSRPRSRTPSSGSCFEKAPTRRPVSTQAQAGVRSRHRSRQLQLRVPTPTDRTPLPRAHGHRPSGDRRPMTRDPPRHE